MADIYNSGFTKIQPLQLWDIAFHWTTSCCKTMELQLVLTGNSVHEESGAVSI
jgi:hypothetical protein